MIERRRFLSNLSYRLPAISRRLPIFYEVEADRPSIRYASSLFHTLPIFILLLGCFEPSMRPAERGLAMEETRDARVEQRSFIDQAGTSERSPSDPDQLPGEGAAFPYPARVRSVLDGDTIEVLLGDNPAATPLRVRFKGVNAPELRGENGAEPFAEEAKDFIWETIGAARVGLEFDSDCSADPYLLCYDGYDRLLAYIRTPGGDDLAALLIEAGLARTYQFRGERFDRLSLYRSLEAEAQRAQRGMWGP